MAPRVDPASKTAADHAGVTRGHGVPTLPETPA